MSFDLLEKAATELSTLCQEIESGADVDHGLAQLFQKAEAHLSTEIDRRKAFLNMVQSRIVQAHNYMDEISTYIKRCEHIINRLKEQTKEAILNNPDLPWRDSFGKKISIAKSQPRLDYEEPQDSAERDQYYVQVIESRLDKAKLKDALLNGKTFSWARLEHNVHLRGI